MKPKNAEEQLNAILSPCGLKWRTVNTNNLGDEMPRKKWHGAKNLSMDEKKEILRNITTFWGKIGVEDSELYAKKMEIEVADSKLFKDYDKVATLTNRVGSFGFSLGYVFAYYPMIERMISEKMKSQEGNVLEHKTEFEMMGMFNEDKSVKQITEKIVKRMMKVKKVLRDSEKMNGLAKEIEEFIERYYNDN